jgi:Tol biopolymer transport system component
MAATVLLVPLLFGLLWFSFFRYRTDSAVREPQTISLTSLPGSENFPAFSPDGKTIAYTWDDAEEGIRSSVYVKLFGAETHLRLTTGPGADGFPHWSPMGGTLRFAERLRVQPETTSFLLSAARRDELRLWIPVETSIGSRMDSIW